MDEGRVRGKVLNLMYSRQNCDYAQKNTSSENSEKSNEGKGMDLSLQKNITLHMCKTIYAKNILQSHVKDKSVMCTVSISNKRLSIENCKL